MTSVFVLDIPAPFVRRDQKHECFELEYKPSIARDHRLRLSRMKPSRLPREKIVFSLDFKSSCVEVEHQSDSNCCDLERESFYSGCTSTAEGKPAAS